MKPLKKFKKETIKKSDELRKELKKRKDVFKLTESGFRGEHNLPHHLRHLGKPRKGWCKECN
mgnify:CR=1